MMTANKRINTAIFFVITMAMILTGRLCWLSYINRHQYTLLAEDYIASSEKSDMLLYSPPSIIDNSLLISFLLNANSIINHQDKIFNDIGQKTFSNHYLLKKSF